MKKQQMSWLSIEDFKRVVAQAILIAIDLVVHDGERLLMGKRLNRPAQGWYFVPGGRMQKGERITAAFRRISKAELGRVLPYKSGQFLGNFQHFWPDNFANDPSFGTHYIAMAYGIKLNPGQLKRLPHKQHGGYSWIPFDEVMKRKDVHPNNRDYVKELRRASQECFSRKMINELVHPPLRAPKSANLEKLSK